MEQIFGTIERIVFQHPENGFTVARLRQPRQQNLTTIVGSFPGLEPGEQVRCQGIWKTNPAHGLQFEVKECTIELPCDPKGIQKYLESGMIQGIGPAYASRIVEQFKEKTLEIIDKNPEALLQVAGIGEKRLEKICTSWEAKKSVREVMIFLHKYGVSSGYAQKIYKAYGPETTDKLKENPYQLAAEIRGIGFKIADTIAQQMGFAADSSLRVDSGIIFVLQELSEEGHVCYPFQDFLVKAAELLSVTTEQIEESLDRLIGQEKVIRQDEFIWLKRFYLCEKGIAHELKRLSSTPCRLRSIDLEKALQWAENKLRIRLAPNQKEAIKKSLTEKIHIITGGPGTGKSTITKVILAITSALSSKIILAAPTGRAAKRMTEITKKAASTIHSLLQYDFTAGSFRRNRQDPLDCDLLIVDEASMIDTPLMYHLLRAIPSHARLLIIGDIHQLPSVGPGNVLKDLIGSETVAVTSLKEIFRQAAGSKIILNAHRINEGEFPFLKNGPKSDFLFFPAETPEQILREVLAKVSKVLPEEYGFDPLRDIQVLSPMKKGVIGIENLNLSLQQCLNSQGEGIIEKGRHYKKGDRVIQLRNDYTKEVYNGDIGIIQEIDKEEQTLSVQFDDRLAIYPFTDLDNLSLAYATSVHKYQGSQRKCIVIPFHPCHYMMLRRNLLYTAVTRGEELVVVIGTTQAIALAIQNNEDQRRFTGLKDEIKKNLIIVK